MRLQRQLPEWAERAIDGTSQQADEISAHRKQVDTVLFELVPGLREDVERTDRESYLEWRAREREVKDALGGWSCLISRRHRPLVLRFLSTGR